MKQTIKRVAVGMSGGVDSSVTAAKLVEAGYDVTGVYLECWRAPGCRSEEDRADALKVALQLGIPFQVLDFKQRYKDSVVEYFFKEYEAGKTPNPDVLCNVEIKFGLFYDWAMEQGFDAIATGHYARLSTIPEEDQLGLYIPLDTQKDQTYFLHRIREEQLAHLLFPLSECTKGQVRDEATQRNLPTAQKKDSVGICFIGDIDVHQFLYDRLGEKPGEVIDTAGNVIGAHKGLWFYTVGQRSGFDIEKKTLVRLSDGSTITKHHFPPFYVIAKMPETNQLVVGFGPETYRASFELRDCHILSQKFPNQALIRIRHTGSLLSCTLTRIKVGHYTVVLDEAVQGIAEGQFGVVYLQDSVGTRCLGGGVITIPTSELKQN